MRFEFTPFELYLALGIIGWPGWLVCGFILMAIGIAVVKKLRWRLICFSLSFICVFPIIYIKLVDNGWLPDF